MKRILLILPVLLALCLPAGARTPRKVTGTPMQYSVENGNDTIFRDTLEPAWVLPRGEGMSARDWRRYYKLVYNFNKVYPYALVGREMMAQVDSTIAADVTRRSERTYEGGFAANFWQLVARLFSQNLKMRYNPSQGEDAQIEELCRIWDSGQWDNFYYSIFMEAPVKTVIKTRTLESEVRKKNR